MKKNNTENGFHHARVDQWDSVFLNATVIRDIRGKIKSIPLKMN